MIYQIAYEVSLFGFSGTVWDELFVEADSDEEALLCAGYEIGRDLDDHDLLLSCEIVGERPLHEDAR